MSKPNVPNAPLPNDVLPQITWMLSELLFRQEGVRLADWPEEWYKLEQYAAKVRGWLESQPRALIRLEEAVRQYPLHTVIYRRTLEALLDLRAPTPHFVSNAPPDRCPACKQLLNGYWDCSYCGLELENAYRHSQLRQASAQPISELPLFYLLLPDPARRRVLILNGEREVVWSLGKTLDAREPVSAVMHREHRLLLADRVDNRVGEFSLFGDCHWAFDTSLSRAHQLSAPVGITAYTPVDTAQELFLLVDRDHHRVLAVDRHSRIHWEYGIRGEAGKEPGQLSSPAYAEYTAEGTVLIADQGNGRVLEIQPEQNNLLVWSSEEYLALNGPCHAHRLLNGHTLIVDPAAWRVIEIDRGGQLLEECIYYHSGHDLGLKIDAPHLVVRLPNQHVVIADQTRVIEINLPAKALVWSALLSELKFSREQDLNQTLSPDEAQLIRMEKERSLQMGHFDLDTSLQRIKMFSDAPSGFYLSLRSYLTDQNFHAGETILREGEEGDTMYLIASGRVKVIRQGEPVATLQTGEIFGEMALIPRQPRSADVVAAEDCTVLKLTKLAFETVLQAYPVIRERIRQLAGAREGMRKLDAFYYAPERLHQVNSLLQAQQQRIADIKQQLDTSRQTSLLRHWHPDWRLLYNRTERHLIHQANRAHQHAYEIHVEVGPGHGGKPATALRIVENLSGLGELLRLWPTVDALEAGKWEQELVLALLTPESRDLVAESLHHLPEIRRIEIHSLFF
ncbi:MAG: hypothetical protein CVV27_07275 [Candidatus Melainabacteria bacterium HGW-Melainabacteria-1]|nr:MAG: hypothetical protein CVV27_07275 [Candidatus Melainabacteria bacterium HGW-Melainabacteria-1]